MPRKKHPTASEPPRRNAWAISRRRLRNWARLRRAWRSIARSVPGGAFRAGDRSDERGRPSGGWDHPGCRRKRCDPLVLITSKPARSSAARERPQRSHASASTTATSWSIGEARSRSGGGMGWPPSRITSRRSSIASRAFAIGDHRRHRTEIPLVEGGVRGTASTCFVRPRRRDPGCTCRRRLHCMQ